MNAPVRMTKITDTLRQQILGLKSEKTTKGIAEQFGVSQSTIRRVFREAAQADAQEGADNEVALEAAPEPDRAAVRAEKKAAEKVPTISLGTFSLGSSQRQVAFQDADLENVITDDAPELDDFEEQWNDGDEEETEIVEEVVEDIPRPTKADEKKWQAIKKTEEDIFRDAVLGGLQDTPQQGKPLSKGAVAEIEEDIALRSRTLSRIYLNVINFRELLPFIKDKDKFLQGLHKKTTRELVSLAGLIETQRSLGNVATQMKNAFFIVAKGTEFGCARLGMKVDGFADDLRQKERELEMIFQEIAVEQADNLKSYTTPQMRLAMIFTSSLMLCDSRNRVMGSAHSRRSPDAPVAPELRQEFSDL